MSTIGTVVISFLCGFTASYVVILDFRLHKISNQISDLRLDIALGRLRFPADKIRAKSISADDIRATNVPLSGIPEPMPITVSGGTTTAQSVTSGDIQATNVVHSTIPIPRRSLTQVFLPYGAVTCCNRYPLADPFERVWDCRGGFQGQSQVGEVSGGDKLASDDLPPINKLGQLGRGPSKIDSLDGSSANSVTEKSGSGLAESDDPVLSHDSSSLVGAAGNRSDSGRVSSPPSPEPTEEDPYPTRSQFFFSFRGGRRVLIDKVDGPVRIERAGRWVEFSQEGLTPLIEQLQAARNHLKAHADFQELNDDASQ